MQQRIGQLEGQLAAQESINEDLIKRIKMLEFCLREERIKYAKVIQSHGQANKENGGANGHTDIINNVLQKANLNANLYEKIAKRRAKAQRPLLLKFLQEVGYEDIFNNQEISEIKDLYDKASQEMKNSLEDPSIYNQQIEERLMNDDNLKSQINN